MGSLARIIRSIADLTQPQARALEGVDVLSDSRGSADMATLRANGNRRNVLDRLCELELVYVASGHGDPDSIRFALTQRGRELLDTNDPTT